MSRFLSLARPVLERQHSLITTAQANDLGANCELLSDLVRREIWERLERGLYGPVGVAMTWHRRLMSAVLLAPLGSLASHRSAAALVGVGGLSAPTPEISIPRGASFRRSGVIVHESVDLHLAEPTVVDLVPTTGLARIAMDLGDVVSVARYRQTVRELRHVKGVSSDELLRTYLRHKQRGRNGGGALRDWLDRYYDVSGVPESGLEQRAVDAILDAGLPAPVLQFWIDTPTGRYRLDAAYPVLKFAIEVDGSQHEDLDARARDHVRDATLLRLGWTVCRVRRRTYVSDLSALLGQIRAAHTASVVTSSGGS
ncbi:DUF559 domain-containing protein [Actinospongicola halichondriae]|uniref:DUF559 domain-containing protein n=1 Tax=Actinospongicola halichondriae TaxID=3236844 RepID=UPI003D4C10F5